MTGRPAPTRVLRGVLLAVTSSALTVTAHGVGGGSPSEFLPALPLAVLAGAASTALADRRRDARSVLLVLGAAQIAQHALLTSVGRHQHAGREPLIDPWQMTAAHALAALLTGLLLARADRALLSLVAAVSRLVPRRLAPPPASAPLRVGAAPVDLRPHVLAGALLCRVHGRRGPPLFS
ncbi:hypothetical protein [Umezawaea beigongshangensis]|uniref:hypothetical protein n=1 Tax=Umezawaea beigongshangensis TaxID=2780383 RepID=UPI0018F10AAF|nr:hypothetical protein [Umezawaea beigongshangensis]